MVYLKASKATIVLTIQICLKLGAAEFGFGGCGTGNPCGRLELS